ncbi:MAG TPA: lipopolysaccharide biosynthesis protein [Candidatus Acidoferrales bacterium]|nr:lipopolysaccharide biosynthesis protein [Candidatus Acidoferrales bacterium]
MKRRRILLNALTTSFQIACNAVILFFLYRFLVRSIGLDGLGIWSLVLATTSVVTLANQGFSTSIVKFVAKYAAREAATDVSALVQTAEIALAAGTATVLILLYPAAKWALAVILPSADLAAGHAVLPYAVASLWVNATGCVLQAGLAGHELITECNYVEVGGALLYLLLAFAWVPTYGLLGLGYAQVAQAIVCFVALWIFLNHRITRLPIIPRAWNQELFREMARYGAHFQLITATQAVREPVTKALLTKFGGPGMTGLYDMAARWVVTWRELIAQANQVLVPTVSSLQERAPAAIADVYDKSYRLIFFLAVPAFAFLFIVSPIVSVVWLGSYEPMFVGFVALLAVAWLVNVLSNPAYVVDLGTGALRWVSIGCLLTAVFNAGAGFVCGKLYGGAAVVVASVASLAGGYAVITIAYHLENRVSLRSLIPPASAGILISSAAAVLIFFPFFGAGPANSLLSAHVVLGLAAVLLTIIVPMWIHPIRRRVWNWVVSGAAA